MTAGLPVNLEGLVGDNGKVFGLDHFGYSAPANVLDEKFGCTGEKEFSKINRNNMIFFFYKYSKP